jgi:hypothetical protein
MTPDQYRQALAALKLTQQGAADFLGVSLRTSQAWATTESSDAKQRHRIPVAVEKLLAAMVTRRLPRLD